jgi:hypothetical protein
MDGRPLAADRLRLPVFELGAARRPVGVALPGVRMPNRLPLFEFRVAAACPGFTLLLLLLTTIFD